VLRRNPITGIVGCCARRQRPRGRAAEQRDEPSTLGALDRGDGIGFKTRPQTRTLLD
jgi:hypothetical protein